MLEHDNGNKPTNLPKSEPAPFSEKVARVRMGIINNIMDGLVQMRSPEESDTYRHGKMVYQTARLDAAVIGWNPNKAEDIARHVLEDEAKREEHRVLDHKLAEEERERDWEIINKEFPGQFSKSKER